MNSVAKYWFLFYPVQQSEVGFTAGTNDVAKSWLLFCPVQQSEEIIASSIEVKRDDMYMNRQVAISQAPLFASISSQV